MRFSIVTPSFRNAGWLKLCVASVADQSVEHEHIIQDAGSDDGTVEWLRDDARVRFFVEKDRGMYDAINRGFGKATGELIAHLNCDEQYLPGALAAVSDFFEHHPEVEIVFADAVAVNASGDYLWHRKMLTPLPWHTRICDLSTLTCSMFYRSSVVQERRINFDPDFKMVGDSEWMVRLLQSGARMAVLRRFTSVFTHTGANLSLKAGNEAARFKQSAPAWLRLLRPLVLLHHRVRRLAGGIYSQAPFSYELYTRNNLQQRTLKYAAHPTHRWRW